MSSWPRKSSLAALLLAAGAAVAQDAYRLEIKALREPVDKSYRRMVRGMDLFRELHAMAPQADLRFKLLPRKHDTDMEDIAVRIVGESSQLRVAVAPDRTFTLDRLEWALDEDASVSSDRKVDTMTWRTQVRTPGLPAHVRRLGDLRLECRVGREAGLYSQYPGVMMGMLQALLDSCSEDGGMRYLFFSERPLFSVTLRHGEHSQPVAIERLYAGLGRGAVRKEDMPYCDCEALLDRAFTLPLGDRSWPNETLVELEYMDEASPAAAKAIPLDDFTDAVHAGSSTREDVLAAMGKGLSMRFDSGYEVWAWQFGPQRSIGGKTEYVVLFNPSGVVAKTRLRPAPPRRAPG